MQNVILQLQNVRSLTMGVFDDIRLWEVRFQENRPMDSFPVPHEIVLERQTSPLYHLEGRGRPVNAVQISCTVSGEGAFRYGDIIYKLTPGKAFICTLGDPQSAYYYPGHAAEPWEFLWVDFFGEQAVRMLEEISGRYGHYVDIPLDSGFVKYLKSFRNRCRSVRFVTPTEGAKIACDIFALLGELLEHDEVVSPGSQLVQSAQLLISENPGHTLNIQEIAEHLQISREHLSRVFRERTGFTLQQFSEEERMQLATRLLRDFSMSCEQVAEQTGYASAASFGRAFRQHFGCSPAQYRNRFYTRPAAANADEIQRKDSASIST